MKDCQIVQFMKLMSNKKGVHPSDLSFFPKAEEEFIKQLIVQQIWDYNLCKKKN